MIVSLIVYREEEGIEMQVLGGGDVADRNEPSTSGLPYHQNEPPSKIYILNKSFVLDFKLCFKSLQLLKDKVVLLVRTLDYISRRKLKLIGHLKVY